MGAQRKKQERKPESPREFPTTRELAEHLGISVHVVRNRWAEWVRDWGLRFWRVGGTGMLRFYRDSVEKMIRKWEGTCEL